jgi:nucleoid DNA-binding protein
MPTPVAKTKGTPARARTQSGLIAWLAGRNGLDRKQVKALLADLVGAAVADLNRADVGKFTIPGLLTLRVVHKPATKEHEGLNPFSRKPMIFKARPARSVIKVRCTKKLRDSIA